MQGAREIPMEGVSTAYSTCRGTPDIVGGWQGLVEKVLWYFLPCFFSSFVCGG